MRPIRYDLTWRAGHVAGMLAVLAAGAILLGWRWANRPIGLGLALPVIPQRLDAAQERINPNTAPVGSLMRLGGIGPVKAAAIAEYAAAHGCTAFRRAEDLQAVEGFGPGMVERLRPYLVFGPADN